MRAIYFCRIVARRRFIAIFLAVVLLAAASELKIIGGHLEQDAEMSTAPSLVNAPIASVESATPSVVTVAPALSAPSPLCVSGKLLEFPKSGLERELERLGKVTAAVMGEVNATYWPTDGTLLGLMRNGRVSTDRDLDYQIHSTFDQCAALLGSLKARFEQRARIKSFKVVKVKLNGRKIGRYAMVRLFREHGTFDTGPDFNCVYMDDPVAPRFYTHKGILTIVPPTVYPLGWCLMYGEAVPCPKDGMAVLAALKPRYDGCMVFPHCLGDPNFSSRRCLSPHPHFLNQQFVDSTIALGRCGFTSLESHFNDEPSCKAILSQEPLCSLIEGSKICFLQRFDG